MKMRRANEHDALGIAKVHIKSWKETYKGIISQDYLDSLNVEDRLKLWEKGLSQKSNASPVFVAVDAEEKIVGFASFGKERTGKFEADGELYAVYILQEYKRNKLGMKLLVEGVTDLLNQNYTSMLVWVLEGNPSRKFYESLNPRKAGEEWVKIDDREHLEIAYVWEDLEQLKLNALTKLGKGE
jgi:L-amino acid N-acyltransferase YncA